MRVRQVRNSLRIDEPDRGLLDHVEKCPGRVAYRGGAVFVEVSRSNLEHMLSRYPELAEAGIPAIQELLGFKRVTSRPLPRQAGNFNFKTEPYAHQREAFARARHAESFALFMEMGTGKTKVLIDNAAALFEEGHIDRVLVVAPSGVHRQWIEEQLPLHCPVPWGGFAFYSGLGKKKLEEYRALMSDKTRLQWLAVPATSLASRRNQELIREWFQLAEVMTIVDESHLIKNPSAKRTKFLMGLRSQSKFRRIATGTDITQGIEDLYSQFAFLDENILGHRTYTSFTAEFCHEAQIPGAPPGAKRIIGYKNLNRLVERIEPFVYRARKEDCLDLPEKIYESRYIELTPEQKKLYREMRDYLTTWIDGAEVTAPVALTKLLRLQQIVCGHITDDEGRTVHIPQFRTDAVVDIARERERGIVWARFREDIEIVRTALLAEGFTVGVYHGDTPTDERTRITQPGAVDWLVANPQTAGTGLNLTHFDTAIYYSNSFNAGERWQSEDRIHRIGQSNHCLYIDLVAPGTIDVVVLRALREKSGLAEMLKDPKRLAQEILSEGAF